MAAVPRIRKRSKRGSAFITSFMLMALLAVATSTYVNSATQTIRVANRQSADVVTSHLCEAGTQSVLRSLWRPFKINQNFTNIDAVCAGATISSPKDTISGSIPGAGNFSSGVISITTPTSDTYTRIIVVRSVGWVDHNNNGTLDPAEPQKIVDVSATYTLSRSKVFDYTYFVNNYGWMDGFGVNDLIVNGDMRANGNFTFTNGSPTVNGSVIACSNDKLVPPAAGLINQVPVKWAQSTYGTNTAANGRVRQSYNSGTMGAHGTDSYQSWRETIFESDASIVNNEVAGAVAADATGTQSWQRTSTGTNGTKTMLDPTPTQEVVMPDLSNLAYYQTLSSTYLDPKATFRDGSANPDYNVGAYVQVWNQNLNGGNGAYQTITTNGVVTGSAGLIGTSDHPIKVHGPITFTQDCVIKGYVSGQGTVYTGRNVHIVGSVRYKNAPDFRGSNITTIDNSNEKKDMVALAARGSVIMGDVSQFGGYPLDYMSPPFTHARYDENGNLIPAFNARNLDGTGYRLYQSVMGDAYIHSIAEGVNQLDTILYTNFVGGGNIGTGGGGVTFNGSIISKDEAMVVWSLPMAMNYDTRIKERSLTQAPLIDLQLPRSPVMLRSSWQDRGFFYGNHQG